MKTSMERKARMKKKNMSWIALVSFIVVIVVNYLAAMGMIPGLLPQKEVSKLYETPITPAGFTFSIWAVIYVLLFLALLYMMSISSKDTREARFSNSLIPFVLGVFFFNILWNLTFGLQWIAASVAMIIGYWLCLLMIGLKLCYSRERLNIVVPIAFGIHTGWISIASIVNIYAYLVKSGAQGITTNPELWSLFGIIASVLLVLILQTVIRNASLPLATAWALFGIYAKEGVSYSVYPFIPLLLLICAMLLVGFSIMTLLKNKSAILPK